MRVKINFPNQKPIFNCSIPVRITDINYGNHLGNDKVLSILHEARMQWLTENKLSEMNVGGHGLIMADSMIAYKNEAFYGDVLDINLYSDNCSEKSFDLLYELTTNRNGVKINIVHAKTGMICFDNEQRKITKISENLKMLLHNIDF